MDYPHPHPPRLPGRGAPTSPMPFQRTPAQLLLPVLGGEGSNPQGSSQHSPGGSSWPPRHRAKRTWVLGWGGGVFCTSLLTPRLRGSVLSVREGAGGSPCCFLAGILGWQEGRKGSSGDPALMGCSSLGSTRGCHLLQPPRVRIVARVGCEGRGCWAMCAPALSLPPDQPADLHADPQGDPGQTPC